MPGIKPERQQGLTHSFDMLGEGARTDAVVQVAGQLLARLFVGLDQSLLFRLQPLVKLGVLQGDDGLVADGLHGFTLGVMTMTMPDTTEG